MVPLCFQASSIHTFSNCLQNIQILCVNNRSHVTVMKDKLTLSSKHFVSMTIVGSLSSQIILQKSSRVFGNGPLQVNNMCTAFSCFSFVYLTLSSNVCFLFIISLQTVCQQFIDSQ